MPPQIAFLGATGGTTLSILSCALRSNHPCTALVRNPDKLTTLLTHVHHLPASLLADHLTIVQGDVRDVEAVRRTLRGADVIVSGLGAVPSWRVALRRPLSVDDPTVCADGVRMVLRVCGELSVEAVGVDGVVDGCDEREGKARVKSRLIVVSTAGVQEVGKPRALPLAYLPWYGWLLEEPLADKIVMEEILVEEMEREERERVVGAVTVVKPSLLTDGPGKGVEMVRAGTGEGPPVGYSVDRATLGEWIWEKVVVEEVWKDERVSVTY